MNIFLVGGAVRDQLLGLKVKERDWVVVNSSPEEMSAAGYQQVGKNFPVFLHPQTKEEHALARTEKKTAPGYTGFDVYYGKDVTLEDDLLRRDLTMNAIAQTADGELIDPFGGIDDINNRVIRHVSAAFAEDPLRVLRVARFAARFASLGFTIAPETEQLMRELSENGELNHLTPERVWVETEKALTTEQPERYFDVLRHCGALAQLFPEIDRLFGVPQPAKWHPEIDTGLHTLLVLQQAALLTDDPVTRFAALTHDLGKGTTPTEEWPGHRNHESRGVPLINDLCDRLAVPNRYRELAVHTSKQHLLIHRAMELRPTTLLKLFETVDAFRKPARFEQLLLACEADMRGRTGLEAKPYPVADYLREAHRIATAISAQDVEPMYEGKAIGEQIRALRTTAIESVRNATRAG
jgi:tRNA nucleotidyltransferase (CCA-adding enzyme)